MAYVNVDLLLFWLPKCRFIVKCCINVDLLLYMYCLNVDSVVNGSQMADVNVDLLLFWLPKCRFIAIYILHKYRFIGVCELNG